MLEFRALKLIPRIVGTFECDTQLLPSARCMRQGTIFRPSSYDIGYIIRGNYFAIQLDAIKQHVRAGCKRNGSMNAEQIVS